MMKQDAIRAASSVPAFLLGAQRGNPGHGLTA
jgi:hypothetical protein